MTDNGNELINFNTKEDSSRDSGGTKSHQRKRFSGWLLIPLAIFLTPIFCIAWLISTGSGIMFTVFGIIAATFLLLIFLGFILMWVFPPWKSGRMKKMFGSHAGSGMPDWCPFSKAVQ